MNNWRISSFHTHILLGILFFKGLTARRLFKSFGVKGLTSGVVVLIRQCVLKYDALLVRGKG
jgi:hypothetical protein